MRLIIEYPDSMPPEEALSAVKSVVELGRISTARGRKQFCHVSILNIKSQNYNVFARPLRYEDSADSFLIQKEKS